MQSSLFPFLHYLRQLILDVSIQGKDVLQFVLLTFRVFMLLSLNLNFFNFASTLLCLNIDIHPHHFISKDDAKGISFDPRGVRSWLN
jgi:hypothetical protein